MAGAAPGGFGAAQVDLTPRRQFQLHERLALQVRADFFNLFNHPNFGPAVLLCDGADHWRMVDAVPDRMTEPGLVMFWFGAELFFANSSFFLERVRNLVEASSSPVRWLVIDATAITAIDFSASRVVMEMQRDLAKAGVVLALVVDQDRSREELARTGLSNLIAAGHIFGSRRACLEAYKSSY